MSERTRREEQEEVMASWMLQGSTDYGTPEKLAFGLYSAGQWLRHPPTWFRISRNVVLFMAVVCLLEYCAYKAIADYLEQVYP